MTTVHHNASRTEDARFPVPRPDEAHWPGLATPPHDALRARIAEGLFRNAVRTLPVRVVFPDGTVLGAGDRHAPVMRMVRPANVCRRAGSAARGTTAFA